MKELVLVIGFVGYVNLTAYRSVKAQTDDSPFYTSTGERCNVHGVAVSQDLLKRGVVHYGDQLFIDGVGWRVVNDCTNERLVRHLDLWVPTAAEEKRVYLRFKNRRVRAWVVRRGM